MAENNGMCGTEQQQAINEDQAINDPRGTMAEMTRAMSLDFFNTAVPVKDELVKMTTYNGNTGVVDGLKKQGMEQVGSSYKNAGETAVRNTERYGMNLTAEQQTAQASALSSSKALAEVDATNRATQYQQDLNKQLVSGIAGAQNTVK